LVYSDKQTSYSTPEVAAFQQGSVNMIISVYWLKMRYGNMKWLGLLRSGGWLRRAPTSSCLPRGEGPEPFTWSNTGPIFMSTGTLLGFSADFLLWCYFLCVC